MDYIYNVYEIFEALKYWLCMWTFSWWTTLSL